MKINTIIVTLALVLLVGGVSRAQSTLEVNIKYCENDFGIRYLSEFKILKNDILVEVCEPQHRSKQTVENLEFGRYRIEYETTFHKTESLQIELSEKKLYSVDLCLDYFDYEAESYKPFIDQIKNGEGYSIQVSSQGCFHYANDTFLISKLKGKYHLIFGEIEKQLTDQEIEAIRHFEMELNYMESSGCTTVDTYVVKFKDEEIKISDGSCNWSGDHWLKKELNLIEEEE